GPDTDRRAAGGRLEELQLMRILVTGGAGYVGFPLCQKLHRRGDHVIVVDSLATTAGREPALAAFADIKRVDITDRAACLSAIVEAEAEVVVHLAALHFIPDCNRRPADAVRINVLGTQNVLDGCAAAPSAPGSTGWTWATCRRSAVTSTSTMWSTGSKRLPAPCCPIASRRSTSARRRKRASASSST